MIPAMPHRICDREDLAVGNNLFRIEGIDLRHSLRRLGRTSTLLSAHNPMNPDD